MGQQITDDGAAFTARLEIELAGLNREASLGSDHSRDALAATNRIRKVFVEALAEEGFVVE
jgi:hypothetical protein